MKALLTLLLAVIPLAAFAAEAGRVISEPGTYLVGDSEEKVDVAFKDRRIKIPYWEILKKGFAVTTLWIEATSIDSVAEHLRRASIPFHGPSQEDYGSPEIELFDPEGFRFIYVQPTK